MQPPSRKAVAVLFLLQCGWAIVQPIAASAIANCHLHCAEKQTESDSLHLNKSSDATSKDIYSLALHINQILLHKSEFLMTCSLWAV